MSVQINQYDKERTAGDISFDDLLDLDSTDNSGSSYTSAKLTIANLLTYLDNKLSLENIYTDDGNINGNRTVGVNGVVEKSITFDLIDLIISSGEVDRGFKLLSSGGVERGYFSYDVSADSAKLNIGDASGDFFIASESIIDVIGTMIYRGGATTPQPGYILQSIDGIGTLDWTESGFIFENVPDNNGLNSIKPINGTNTIETTNTYYSVIGGGLNNTIRNNAYQSVISGGDSNVINNNSKYSVIGGGQNNSIADFNYGSFIGGGVSNVIQQQNYYNVIAGGLQNIIGFYSYQSAILGGNNNIINQESYYCVIGGGTSNQIFNGAQRCGIFSGVNNDINVSSNSCSILGGNNNEIGSSGNACVIGSGINNTIGNSVGLSGIFGGTDNTIENSSSRCFITGGTSNTISNNLIHSSIIGGTSNTVNHDNANVIGSNIITSQANATYVENIIINNLISTTTLATDVNGKVVAGVSDERLKKNIKPIKKGLDIIKELNGVSYEWTKESNMGENIKKFGLIAQQVQEIIPEMVNIVSNTEDTLSLDYKEIIPFLIEAIKELNTKVDNLNIK